MGLPSTELCAQGIWRVRVVRDLPCHGACRLGCCRVQASAVVWPKVGGVWGVPYECGKAVCARSGRGTGMMWQDQRSRRRGAPGPVLPCADPEPRALRVNPLGPMSPSGPPPAEDLPSAAPINPRVRSLERGVLAPPGRISKVSSVMCTCPRPRPRRRSGTNRCSGTSRCAGTFGMCHRVHHRTNHGTSAADTGGAHRWHVASM